MNNFHLYFFYFFKGKYMKSKEGFIYHFKDK